MMNECISNAKQNKENTKQEVYDGYRCMVTQA